MLSCFSVTCFSGPRPPWNRPIRLPRWKEIAGSWHLFSVSCSKRFYTLGIDSLVPDGAVFGSPARISLTNSVTQRNPQHIRRTCLCS